MVVLHGFAAGQKQRSAGQVNNLGVFPAIVFEIRQ
jgi:hypothetical protein